MTALSDSEHFHFEELAPGVVAALAKQDGLAASNCGIIDLGDQTIIFDTSQSLAAAKDLRDVAERYSGRKVTQVILSHGHSDHWLGNQVFSDCAILATKATCESFHEMAEDIEKWIQNPLILSDEIAKSELNMGDVTDQIRKSEMQRSLNLRRALLADLPNLKICPPTATFSGSLQFNGSKLNAELVQLPGHTAGDCIILLPSESLAFIGDLGFFHAIPFMPSCDPEQWIRQIEFLESQDIHLFCPGHGPLGTRGDLELQELYMLLVSRWVKDGISTHASLESLHEMQLPEDFRTWASTGKRHAANLDYLYAYFNPPQT